MAYFALAARLQIRMYIMMYLLTIPHEFMHSWLDTLVYSLQAQQYMVYSSHMVRTQVYLPKEVYQHINLVAQKEQKPAAQVIRELLYDGLVRRQKTMTIGQALQQLTQVKAQAPEDLSTNIDAYLYGV